MRSIAAIAATTLVLTQVRDARAETFSVSSVDPVGCTEQQHLIEQVTARANGAAFVESGGRFSFVVRLERNSDKIVAELQIGNPDNSRSTRVVDGASCEEVTSALALIMALTLDPRRGSADTQPEPAHGADALPAPESPAPAHAAPAPTAVRSSTYVVEGDFRESAAKQSPQNSAWRVGIGAELKWMTNDGGMWLLGLRGEGAKAQRLFTVIHASLGPKVVRDDGKGTSVAFSFYGAGAELGTPIVASQSLATDAMIVALLGGLHVAGVQQGPTTIPRDATTTWAGIGPGLRLRWFSDTASVAFETTVPINLVRPAVVVVGTDGLEQMFYRTPAAGIFFGLCGIWNVEPSTQRNRVIKAERHGD